MIDLNESCMGHWRLNDSGSSSLVIDSSGSGRDGQLVDLGGSSLCSAHTVAGRTGTAISFDGVDDRIDLPGNEPQWLGASDFAVSLWAYFNNDYDQPYAHHEVLVQGNGHWSGSMSNSLGWTVHRDGEQAGRLKFYLVLSDGTLCQLNSNAQLSSQKWWHIVVMRHGNQTKIYIDGTLDSSASCSSAAVDYVGNYDEDTVVIGAFATNIDYRYHFNGIMDNVMFFDQALTDDEVSWLWNNGNGTERLVSCARSLVSGTLASPTMTGKGVI